MYMYMYINNLGKDGGGGTCICILLYTQCIHRVTGGNMYMYMWQAERKQEAREQDASSQSGLPSIDHRVRYMYNDVLGESTIHTPNVLCMVLLVCTS